MTSRTLIAALLLGAVSVLPSNALALPEYMEHWEFGINVDEDQGPSYFADVIVPLYRPDDDSAIFMEPRVDVRDHEWLTNFGWGYRVLLPDRTWLLGANMFYDRESEYSHYRLGWGLEALSSYAEARANYYLGLSSQRVVEETTTTQTLEEAVDGFDVELGAPVPYYSKVKVFGGFLWYNFKNFDNLYGWRLRTEYTPWPFLVVDGTLSNDTKHNVDWGMTWAVRIPVGGNTPTSLASALELDATMFPEGDASNQLWRLVERHHEIIVEAERKSASLSVEVVRNN